ncbi:hypothetical protein QWJ34_12470 [Saccharibacillus sp. CPCC 101409]|uniref:hypothetical protein n=1 Tax=Saccharibacillus sp. CPCC 101409 TaxID=3058041 RepID=UPI002670FC05|nr:hypothetical protein [Saccharibacillus sp. CPCC 101409]MDO3410578.1 hypothetical protein [Saccharibacillus sp. CPCC 101409]
MFSKIFSFLKNRRLKYELTLVKPIFDILNDRKEIFENHWNARTIAYDLLTEEDIRDVLNYTHRKLIELKSYLDTVQTTRKNQQILTFYKQFNEDLLKYHNRPFDSYPGTYMYFYSELLLGAERYLTIKKELET